ncbi:MAG: AraC family transcriptional regulator [Paenibacillus sp. RIFOXYA1_FULL_44_5]|nr:MAG: AraC family transcriptional regulator [Paenibacillus sp. RIFOXYA1_FULL_44_5]
MRPVSHVTVINPYPGKGEITVLFAGNGQTAPVHKVGPQVLDYYLVHFILSGEGRFHCRGHEYILGAGDSFFIFPGELASYISDEQNPWCYRWIGFKGSHANQFLQQINISADHSVITGKNNRRIPALFHQIQQLFQFNQSNCDMKAGGYMRLLLSEYAQNMNNSATQFPESAKEIELQIEQAIRWLTLQYSQQISIENMAQMLGYHRTHLSRMFKQYTGLSPMNFLLKIRMERAKLLLHERLTIEQVASSVGFPDALYFSKQFKKWHGSSPKEFRHSIQGKERFDCSFSS